MPGMDGVEALSWFRRGSTSRFTFLTPSTTPVVAVTANALEGDERRFLDLGFDAYLSKPFRQSQLQKVLIEHIQATSPLDSATDVRSDDEGPTTVPQALVAAEDESRNDGTLSVTQPAVLAVDPPSSATSSAPSAAPLTAVAAGPSGALTPADVLDPESLRRLRELDPHGDNRLIERVAKAFENSVNRLLPQLDEAFKMNDSAAIMHVAHTLKSSSASIGALKLSQMCAEIETMIRRQTGEDLTSRIREIPLEAARVLEGLRHLQETQA
jgi:CheY-like chemotaxis protein